jgi:cold-inducible RNA-binding protein
MKNLYVGNLTANVTADDLNHNFSEVGAVLSAVIIKDKFTNTSKGFGFVEMDTEEGAREAIKRFNGGQLDGASITVNEARPKSDNGQKRREPFRGGGSRSGYPRAGGRY